MKLVSSLETIQEKFNEILWLKHAVRSRFRGGLNGAAFLGAIIIHVQVVL